eukprot:TRINITY_DN1325_c0_g1_i5.p1 TRINITY_DN1325_c0_g1~~TRINITY_DN1325_c0_g1_i5.p1  ORF type:complete len:125 (-),score=36.04 TRINITY_DN1325_c0_g1_i5:115-489(-)
MGEVPLFPFGHGLSYTTFSYGAVTATKDAVSLYVTNTGTRSGAEVPQLYLGYPPSSGEPPKVLRGFDKVTLAPAESKKVVFPLTSFDVSVWDTAHHQYVVVPGNFTVYVGASSSDIRQMSSFQV